MSMRTSHLACCVYSPLCLDGNARFPRTSPYYSAAPTAQRVSALALGGEDFPELSCLCPGPAEGCSQTRLSGRSSRSGCDQFPQITKNNAFHIDICLSNLGNILKICHTFPPPQNLRPSSFALPAPPHPMLPVAMPPWSPRLLPARGLSRCLHQTQPPGSDQWHLHLAGLAHGV